MLSATRGGMVEDEGVTIAYACQCHTSVQFCVQLFNVNIVNIAQYIHLSYIDSDSLG